MDRPEKYCFVDLEQNCRLRGRIVQTNSLKCETPVGAFLGVPYAKPPVGKLRFKYSEPLDSLWEGTRDALEYGPVCPQDPVESEKAYAPFPLPPMDEICLFLNIWKPLVPTDGGKIPVIVYIHGGSFQLGHSNMHNGTVFAAHERVIFISLNYRVGPLGFFYTSDGTCPGNMGISDVLTALRWIHKYILRFGGDPDNITIMGQSAGGMIVSLLMVSPQARGLFHKAISQSGLQVDSTIWSTTQANKFYNNRLLQMGYTGNTRRELGEFLQTISTEELLKHFVKGGTTSVVDGTLLPDHPRTTFAQGRSHRVPYLIGHAGSDGYTFALGHLQAVTGELNPEPSRENIHKALRKFLFETFRNSATDAKIDVKLMSYYNLNSDEEESDHRMQKFTDLITDGVYASQVSLVAETHSKHSQVYVYLFDERVPEQTYPEWVTTCHSDDLAYIQGYPFLDPPHAYRPTTPDSFTHSQTQFSRDVMKRWAQFARTGTPNIDNLVMWEPYRTPRNNSKHVFLLKKTEPDSNQIIYDDNITPDGAKYWNYSVFPVLGVSRNKRSML